MTNAPKKPRTLNEFDMEMGTLAYHAHYQTIDDTETSALVVYDAHGDQHVLCGVSWGDLLQCFRNSVCGLADKQEWTSLPLEDFERQMIKDIVHTLAEYSPD